MNDYNLKTSRNDSSVAIWPTLFETYRFATDTKRYEREVVEEAFETTRNCGC